MFKGKVRQRKGLCTGGNRGGVETNRTGTAEGTLNTLGALQTTLLLCSTGARPRSSDETGRLHGLKGLLGAAQCSSWEGHIVIRVFSLFQAIWSHQDNSLTC